MTAGPEGHSGAAVQSSAADSHPVIDSSDKPQTGPASDKTRTASLVAPLT
jgi:hypothetical protein